MPEPVTLVIVGAAALAFLKNHQGAKAADVARVLPGAPGSGVGVLPGPATAGAAGQPLSTGASGTGPGAPLATHTGVVNGIPIAAALSTSVTPIPPLAMVLDNDTAMKMRAYAALHPDDFQVFLDRYADYIVLRDDMFFQVLKNPPAGGFHPTPQMGVSLGSAAYTVVQGLNGVAAGNYGDLFGIASTVAGKVPGLNPDFVHALQGLTLGYRAFTVALQVNQIAAIAAANGVSIMNVTGTMLVTGGETAAAKTLAMGAGAESLASAPIASMGGMLMAAGLCLDIAFTIIGNAPDLQKAIDVALDVAALVCLFIPVVGWIIAIVIELVKFIIDLFAADLFYSKGQRAHQRALLESAVYGENVAPMFTMIAEAYSPRELYARIVEWGGSQYWGGAACGGLHAVTMLVDLVLHPGDTLMVGGVLYTVPAETTMTFGRPGCPLLAGTPFAPITDDEQAYALAKYGHTNGVHATAEVGVEQSLRDQFETPTEQLIAARCAPLQPLVDHGLSLDQIDQIVAEYRAQPALHDLAAFCGYAHWQDMLGAILMAEWTAWASSVTHGTLTDFAKANGYPTMYAWRAAALLPWQQLRDRVLALEALVAYAERFMPRPPVWGAPLDSVFPAFPELQALVTQWIGVAAEIAQGAPSTVPPAAGDLARLALGPGDTASAALLARLTALETRMDRVDHVYALAAAYRAAAPEGALAPRSSLRDVDPVTYDAAYQAYVSGMGIQYYGGRDPDGSVMMQLQWQISYYGGVTAAEAALLRAGGYLGPFSAPQGGE